MQSVSPVTILAISGSLRGRSSNTVLIQAAAALAPTGARVVIYAGLADLPHFNPDLDTPARPAAVVVLRRLVAAADAILISSPEYAHGVPGSLKNGLDWLVSGTEFPNIPVALLGASSHAVHARAALAETLRTMSGELVEQASVTVPLNGRSMTMEELLADTPAVAAITAAMAILTSAAKASRRSGRRFVSRPLDDGTT